MKLNTYEKWILASLCAVLIFVLAAIAFTGGWATYFESRQRTQATPAGASLVDSRPLTTAQTLAPLAATPGERQFAEDALRLGDHSVDLNFSAALHDATENPPPANRQTTALDQRIKAANDAVDTDKDRVAELTRRLAAASVAAKDGIQDQLALEQAQLSLDQDALQDAQEDLARAGGDNQARIQQMMDEHNASESHSSGSAGTVGADAPSIELTKARNLQAEVEAWLSLRSKDSQLLLAQREALASAGRLNTSHDALEKKLATEAQQNTASHPELSSSANATNSQSAQSSDTKTDPLTLIHQMTQDQKDLSSFDTRIGTEQQLATVYGNWSSLVEARKQIFLRRFLTSVLWILVISLFVIFLHRWVKQLFDNINLERRQLHTLRAVVLFGVRTLGLAAILVIIFGVPTNLATAVGLVGAGLAVGLQDFIVGFFGWFILIGRDGIRVGDWVEINGVGGEVLEVGLFQTILLESGTLNDAGRPTGRKVSFVNSYAVQGHYFNFSTSGQWLWDEVEVQIPANVEPYEMSEAFQKIAVRETATNARLAEEEWKRGTPLSAKQSFSAVPSFSLRPTATGVSVLVRYITRVNERHEVRERIYRDAVELLRNTKSGESPALPPPPVNPVTANTVKEPA
jgi:Mechanosensitive ion channel